MLVRRLIGWLAILFGSATLVAGGRVLAGADPGYVVVLPLVAYNTTMGAAYIVAGVFALRGRPGATAAAGAIAALNGAVFGTVVYLRANAPDVVAPESVAAMTFRTLVWVVFWLGLSIGRRANQRIQTARRR